MTIKPPPTFDKIVDEGGKATLSYTLFFEQIFKGDTGASWNPEFTDLVTVGTPTIAGIYYRIGQLVYFAVTVTPETSTTSTAGTTYINNFPLQIRQDGACLAVSGNLGSQAGMCVASNNRIYVPVWNAVTVPLTVVGLVVAQ